MAAPALKPCPVCAGTKLTGSSRVRCQDCGMWVDQGHEGLTAFVWNRLSDLAAARTRAAVREALEEAERFAQGRLASAHAELVGGVEEFSAQYLAGEATGSRLIAEHIRAHVARLDAAPSAQPEGDADA